MLGNFQLGAIVKSSAEFELYRIPLHQELQAALAESWHEQFQAFTGDIDEVPFDAGYTPEAHERFRLDDYDLPEGLAGEDSQSVVDFDSIGAHEDVLESVKGLAAFCRDDEGRELVLFQNFSRSHVIRPGRFLFMPGDTYQTAERPGLTLDVKLSAVYRTADRTLLFHNFRTTNTFLPLAEFYEEASEHDIREVLEHDLLAPEDPDALAVRANQWFRKRFAMLRDSGILDQYTAQQIADHAQGYEVDVVIEEDQIVFPADKAEAKRLLQYLNEEIFRGAITDTLYETNSKREAD